MKLHKVHNTDKELVPCKGRIEVYLTKPCANVGAEAAGGSGKEAKASKFDGCRTMDSSMNSKLDEILIRVKEWKDEVVGIQQLKKTVEAMQEEIVKVRQEFNKAIEETVEKVRLEMISTVRKEMYSVGQTLPKTGTKSHEAGKKKSYSDAVARKKESIIIVKSKEKSDACSSDQMKRDIKSSIDVAKLGVGITATKKVTKGAVVIGCKNKDQAEILRNKVANDMREKYIIQAPKKKKLKIKIFYVDKEDCEQNQEFWRRIEEQNGFTRNTLLGQIVHKSLIGKSRRMMIIAEVDAKTHDVMLEEGRVKIG